MSLVFCSCGMKPLVTSWRHLPQSQHELRKPHPVLFLEHVLVSVSNFFVCQTLTDLFQLLRASSAQQRASPPGSACPSCGQGRVKQNQGAQPRPWLKHKWYRVQKWETSIKNLRGFLGGGHADCCSTLILLPIGAPTSAGHTLLRHKQPSLL